MFCKEMEHVEQQETHRMLREWQIMHPYASWTLLYQALIQMNETEMSKVILKRYLSGMFEILLFMCIIICIVILQLCLFPGATFPVPTRLYVHTQ